MKLEHPIPICLSCGVCLDNESITHHIQMGHNIAHSDCLHPFLGSSLGIGLECLCDCEGCKVIHR